MDPTAALALASAGLRLVPLGVKTYRFCASFREKAPHEKKIVCLVMPPKSGKTALANSLHPDEDRLIVDLDEAVKSMLKPEESRIFDDPKALSSLKVKMRYNSMSRAVYRELSDNYKGKKRILLLCNSIDIVRHLEVKPENTFVCVPSAALWENITEAYNPDDKKAVDRARLELLMSCPRSQCVVYDSFETLYTCIKTTFALHSRI